jgi:hypothetical protein
MKLFIIILLTLSIGCGPVQAAPAKYEVRELAGTDSDCSNLDEIFGKENIEKILPRPLGWFSAGNAVTLHRVPFAMIKPVRNPGEATAPGSQHNRSMGLRLLSVRPEDTIQENLKEGKLEVRRPFFTVFTKGGSIIRGSSMYTIKPEEIKAVVRVIRHGAANEVTIFWII